MDRQLKQRSAAERVTRGKHQATQEADASARWNDVLASFVAEYKGVPVSIGIVEADGTSRALDPSASVELRLMSIGQEIRDDGRVVVLFVHKYPGAQIAQIEFSRAVHLEQDDGKLTVGAADGCRIEVHASGVARA